MAKKISEISSSETGDRADASPPTVEHRRTRHLSTESPQLENRPQSAHYFQMASSSSPNPSPPTETGTRPRTHSMSGNVSRRLMMRTPPPSSPSPSEIRGRRRRLDSLNLDPPRHSNNDNDNDHVFHIGRYFFPSVYSSCYPRQHETMVQGEELYLHFFHEQIRNAGLDDQVVREEARTLGHFHDAGTHLDNSTPRRVRTTSLNLENFQDPIWRQTGRDLQFLADEFARSHERLLVRQRAQEVDISTLTKDKFIAMLAELFKGGKVTRERILVLFFFCSDVAIFAIQTGAGRLLSSLTEWSLIFIKGQVCSWVQNNGGWREVLHSGFNVVQQSLVFGSCVMFIMCCAIYIRKNLPSSSI